MLGTWAFMARSEGVTTVVVAILLVSLSLILIASSGTGEPSTRVSKPTGWGLYPRAYEEYLVAIPSRVSEGLDENVTARVYYPGESSTQGAAINDSLAPYPTIVYLPGGSSTHSYVDGNAAMIASYGFVVVNIGIGYMPGSSLRHPHILAQDVSVVIDWINATNSTGAHLLEGMMDMERLGISGHSWGGVTAAYAVTDQYGDDRLKASHPVSPTAYGDLDSCKTIDVPFQVMCGSSDNSPYPFYNRATQPKTAMIIAGADHQSVRSYEEYQVSFFRYWFYKDKDYETFIYTDQVRADWSGSTISGYAWDLSTCEVEASHSSINEDDSVTFWGNITGLLLNDTVSFEWDLDGDGTFEINSTSNQPIVHIYNASGSYTPTFRYTDTYESETVDITLSVINVYPDAYVGPNQTAVEDEVVALEGWGSDTPTDEPSLMYKWDFGDGQNTNWLFEPNTTHTYIAQGNYTATFTVRDDNLFETSAQMNVNVSNVAPTAIINANKLSVMEEEKVTFDAYSSFDTFTDNSTLSFLWDFGDSKMDTGQLVYHTYSKAGQYTVILTATDDNGAKDQTNISITVSNLPPTVVYAGEPITVVEDQEVSFTGSAIDDSSDERYLEFKWDFGDGNSSVWSSIADATHTYTDAGAYEAILWVRDDDEDTHSMTRNVTINNVAPSGSTSVDSTTVNEYDEVSFSCTYTDTASDHDTLSILWEMEGTTYKEDEPSHRFTTPGKHIIIFTVTDDDGEEYSETLDVTVINVAPTAKFGASKTTVQVGELIIFNATQGLDTPNDRSSLVYTWDFDEGWPDQGPEVMWAYSTPGVKTVTLTVEDNDNATSQFSIQITVLDHVDPGNNQTNGTDGNTTTTGSEDLSGLQTALIIVLVIIGVLVLLIISAAIVIFIRRNTWPYREGDPPIDEPKGPFPPDEEWLPETTDEDTSPETEEAPDEEPSEDIPVGPEEEAPEDTTPDEEVPEDPISEESDVPDDQDLPKEDEGLDQD